MNDHARVKNAADPKQVRKNPDDLQPGQQENIRLDPERINDYEIESKSLDAQYATALARKDEMVAKLKAFEEEKVEVEFFTFNYGLSAVPLDMNGSYMVELEWMIQEPEKNAPIQFNPVTKG